MPETATNLLQNNFPAFATQFSGEILGEEDLRDHACVVVKPGRLVELMQFLKSEAGGGMHLLADLFAMDYLKSKATMPDRFAVVYNLTNIFAKRRLFVKTYLSEERPEVPSLVSVFKAADWFEREAWDLYGIKFIGHPNLIRILCHNDFEGHPLRKDYPSDRYQRLKSAVTSTGL